MFSAHPEDGSIHFESAMTRARRLGPWEARASTRVLVAFGRAEGSPAGRAHVVAQNKR